MFKPSEVISPARKLHEKRGRAPKGMRWRDPNVYVPAGPRCNVRPSIVKNKAVAFHTNVMHVQWYQKKFGKADPEMNNVFAGDVLAKLYPVAA